MDPDWSPSIFLPPISRLANQLKTDTYELCQPEGRMVGSDGHRVAEDFVRRRLGESGCVPYVNDSFDLPYDGRNTQMPFTNFAGLIPGQNPNLPPLLIGAHYDSVIAAPCADDNGASVAACLAVAKIIKDCGGLNRDLIIAIFDAEEPPYFLGSDMGSTRFYEEQLDWRGVHFALIHDMIAHDVSIPIGSVDMPLPLLKNALFMTGAESNPSLPSLVKEAGIPKGLKLGATLNRYIGDLSDHAVFRKNDIPYLFCSCGLWAHYHRETDTPDRLNYKKLARVTNLSCKILEQADQAPLDEIPKEDHTLDFEIASFKSMVSPGLPLLLKTAGLKKLETRDDIEKMVRWLCNKGLGY